MKPWVTRRYALLALLDFRHERRLHVELLELFELDVFEEGVVLDLLRAVVAQPSLGLR